MNGLPGLVDLPGGLKRKYQRQMEEATLGAIDLALAGPVALEIRDGADLLRFDPVILEPAVEYLADDGDPRGRRSAHALDVFEMCLGVPDLRTFSCSCTVRAHLRSNLTLARSLSQERCSVEPLDADPGLLERAGRLAEEVGGSSAIVLGLFPRLPRGAVRSVTVLQGGRRLRIRLERDVAQALTADCLVAVSQPDSGIKTWWLETCEEVASMSLSLAVRPN